MGGYNRACNVVTFQERCSREIQPRERERRRGKIRFEQLPRIEPASAPAKSVSSKSLGDRSLVSDAKRWKGRNSKPCNF
jgi:hypothetical protein